VERRSLPIAVALVSAGSLAYEILLVRVFAVEHFHHFAYLAVGVAMLGFGAGGTAITLVPAMTPERCARWLRAAVALAPFSLLLSPALVHRIPLDPTQLAWDASQWPPLGLAELILALPFAVCGLVVLLALATRAERPGGLYAAGFLGAGAGAVASVLALGALPPRPVLATPALLAALGAAAYASRRGGPAVVRLLAVAAIPLSAAAVVAPPWRLTVTPYKALPQVEAYPGARRVAEEPSPVGWLVQVEAPAFRYAPGLSLAYRGAFPRQQALFVDGQLAGAISTWRRDEEIAPLLDHLPTAGPYALGRRDRVLVIGGGEGLEVLNAMSHGARRITAVELHRGLARRVMTQRTLGGAKPARWIVGDARGTLARTQERYDLITMGAGGAFGTTAAGVHSLEEDFLHTTDAYGLYLNRLAEGGVLSVTRWLAGPPREPVRTILTACEALRRGRPGALPQGLIVMRSWATATVLVKPSGFSREEAERLRGWAAARNFDLDWYPGIGGPPQETFNQLEAPVLYDAARAAVSGPRTEAAFADAYPFLVSPVSDARPYAHHFLRPASLRALLRADRASWLPIAEWGLVALLATLLWSVLLAAILLLLPAFLRARGGGLGSGSRLVAYFALLGFGYLAAEIAVIQQLHLLLGHPVYAVTAALTGLLIGSGLGSAFSDWLAPRALPGALAGLVILLAAEALLLLPIARAAEAAPLAVRVMLALVAIAPPAVLMGLPFPVGLRALAEGHPRRVAWAWAANGFASVVAAPLSALIALEWGTRILFLAAAGGYALALAMFPRRRA
jgi:hypothetical protein